MTTGLAMSLIHPTPAASNDMVEIVLLQKNGTNHHDHHDDDPAK
jgi:hypothetical protein